VQTQFILDAMDHEAQQDLDRWDKLNASLDLLFTRVDEINLNQQQVIAKLNINTKAVGQLAQHQQAMAKQIAETGRAGG
jgi:hypothetical protein